MKILKKEEGITGIDITIAIILITIFISIIATLFYNIQKTSTELERETIATSYAVEIIEEIKALGFGQLPNVDEGTNQITGYELFSFYWQRHGNEKSDSLRCLDNEKCTDTASEKY